MHQLSVANAAGVPATQNPVLGGVIGIAILGAVLYGLADAVKRHEWVPALLIASSLLFSFGTARGRICLGFGVALGSRYIIYVTPAYIGTYLLTRSTSSPLRKPLWLGSRL